MFLFISIFFICLHILKIDSGRCRFIAQNWMGITSSSISLLCLCLCFFFLFICVCVKTTQTLIIAYIVVRVRFNGNTIHDNKKNVQRSEKNLNKNDVKRKLTAFSRWEWKKQTIHGKSVQYIHWLYTIFHFYSFNWNKTTDQKVQRKDTAPILTFI